MGKAKIAITLDERIVERIDKLVQMKVYPSRSRAIEEAVDEKLQRVDRSRLARESAKLDVQFEKALADEGLSEELGLWPEY
jgi:metal-responsive CopG/Arc/MetJ family transcriptional regulator